MLVNRFLQGRGTKVVRLFHQSLSQLLHAVRLLESIFRYAALVGHFLNRYLDTCYNYVVPRPHTRHTKLLNEDRAHILCWCLDTLVLWPLLSLYYLLYMLFILVALEEWTPGNYGPLKAWLELITVRRSILCWLLKFNLAIKAVARACVQIFRDGKGLSPCFFRDEVWQFIPILFWRKFWTSSISIL